MQSPINYNKQELQQTRITISHPICKNVLPLLGNGLCSSPWLKMRAQQLALGCWAERIHSGARKPNRGLLIVVCWLPCCFFLRVLCSDFGINTFRLCNYPNASRAPTNETSRTRVWDYQPAAQEPSPTLNSTIGAYIVTYILFWSILRVPSYIYSLMAPKPYSNHKGPKKSIPQTLSLLNN